MTEAIGQAQEEWSAHILNFNLGFHQTDDLQMTNLDEQGLLKARRTATISGTMLSVVHQYLWDATEMIARCRT